MLWVEKNVASYSFNLLKNILKDILGVFLAYRIP